MFKPSPVLSARLRLTTKQVNGGYYKGNRTGSMGAFTQYGQYIIDYRKVRHYNMPDLTDFPLTPFVTKEMDPTKREIQRADGTTFEPPKVDGMHFLREWKIQAPDQYQHILNYQSEQEPMLAAGESTEIDVAPENESQEKLPVLQDTRP